MFNILRPLSRQHWAAIGCTVNGQPIRVTVHSDLSSDELLSYMQGMGCSELGKNTIFNEHPLADQQTGWRCQREVTLPIVIIYIQTLQLIIPDGRTNLDGQIENVLQLTLAASALLKTKILDPTHTDLIFEKND